jgi:hypothetical protein
MLAFLLGSPPLQSQIAFGKDGKESEQPVDGEYIFESLSQYQSSSLAKGIPKLSQLVIGV